MVVFAWIVISTSFFISGWYARKLYDFIKLIDESHYEARDYER